MFALRRLFLLENTIWLHRADISQIVIANFWLSNTLGMNFMQLCKKLCMFLNFIFFYIVLGKRKAVQTPCHPQRKCACCKQQIFRTGLSTLVWRAMEFCNEDCFGEFYQFINAILSIKVDFPHEYIISWFKFWMRHWLIFYWGRLKFFWNHHTSNPIKIGYS